MSSVCQWSLLLLLPPQKEKKSFLLAARYRTVVVVVVVDVVDLLHVKRENKYKEIMKANT